MPSKLSQILAGLRPISALPINGYITTMTNTLSSKLFRPFENLQYLSDIMKKQFEIVAVLRRENQEISAHAETLERNVEISTFAKTENESLALKLRDLEEKYGSERTGWIDEKKLLQNRVSECEIELQQILDLLEQEKTSRGVAENVQTSDQENTCKVNGIGARVEQLISALVLKCNMSLEENQELLAKMGKLCKDLDFQDDEIERKGRLVENLILEVNDIIAHEEDTHLDLLSLKQEYHLLVTNSMMGKNQLISQN